MEILGFLAKSILCYREQDNLYLAKLKLRKTIIGHIRSHHAFTEKSLVLKLLEKHLNWYLKRFNADEKDIRKVLLAGNPDEQIDLTLLLLERLDLSINLL